jgi:hypothetical protein
MASPKKAAAKAIVKTTKRQTKNAVIKGTSARRTSMAAEAVEKGQKAGMGRSEIGKAIKKGNQKALGKNVIK